MSDLLELKGWIQSCATLVDPNRGATATVTLVCSGDNATVATVARAFENSRAYNVRTRSRRDRAWSCMVSESDATLADSAPLAVPNIDDSDVHDDISRVAFLMVELSPADRQMVRALVERMAGR